MVTSQKRYFIITFNDLTESKKSEIIENIAERFIHSAKGSEVMEMVGSDPTNVSKPNGDAFLDLVYERTKEQAESSYVEWEVIVDIERKKRK